MKLEIKQFAKNFIESIPKENWYCASKLDIEKADGRKDKTNIISQNGSIVYVAYADTDVLYVGESSKSIKRRFISDGSGSHQQANNLWYEKMTHIKFLKYEDTELPEVYRKLLEQLLSVEFNPTNYGQKT